MNQQIPYKANKTNQQQQQQKKTEMRNKSRQ